ncbi:zinc finger BED domain-containing protein RICESLEEPER 1 [Arachis duranensis]|uniref:Zinc finger BED domain-containing protein RICESLEEPER 1 n=1 Tax=Arachis duranensis TaxID=130453 RepID=A0A6P5MED6_ARADU|nr:zinc finger BED domain-containing protein RICESLEEPER 1 [Arachis duranensis]XP_015973325.1 zinc finger BED domain-containing protein RICESLEEPER 1 [Arachis duranensis]XP_020982820.1 zinc finger BED domain-containing protein RICESLEEPER 1 [Arachis duranensis]
MDLSDAVIVKSSRLKSVVWNDFDRIKKGDTCVAVCRHCKRKLSGSSSSGTSHLRNHLIRCQRRSSHGIAQYVTAKEKRKDTTVTVANFNFDNKDHKKDDPLSFVNVKLDQEQLKDENVNAGNCNFDQRRSRFDLARMIILHGYPLAMVEHVGFRVFVKNLQPLFELVTMNRVEADCIEIYDKEKQKVNEMLDKLRGKISLGADVWTTSNGSEFLCSTANYIDESWLLRRRILNFVAIDPSHTEDMLSATIMTCLMDWDIDRKLFSVVLDSTAGNDVAIRIGERLSQNRFLYCNGQLFDIRCAASVLHVMVQHALVAISELISKVRESIRYVRSSQTVQAKFDGMAKEVGIRSQKCLTVDNPFQWNTTHSMLEAVLEFKDVFILLQENDDGCTVSLSDVEWDRVSAITNYLKLFVEVTNVFTRSKYPTANIYFPELCDVKLHLIEWCNNSDEYISSLALRMRSKFDEYWEKCSLGLAVAAMLDPRFKMKLVEYYYPQIYGSTSSARINEVLDSVKALYNEHSICSPLAFHDEGLPWQVGSVRLSLPTSAKDSRDRLMGFDKFLNETSQGEGMKSDLDKYLEEPLFPRNVDFSILNWWKVHTPRYPVLSMMARNMLGIPMSKVPPELAFNTDGRVLDRDWSSLNPATIQALVCSQDWIRNELEN